jgi:hypothetical protein
MSSGNEAKRLKLSHSSIESSMSSFKDSFVPSTPKSCCFHSNIVLPAPSIPPISSRSIQSLRSPRISPKGQALSPLLLPLIETECGDEEDCLWSRDNTEQSEYDPDSSLRKRRRQVRYARGLQPKFSSSTFLDLSSENGVYLTEELDCEPHDDVFGTIRVEGMDGLDSPGYLLHSHSVIESDGSFFNERL